jgi:NAD(P)-dependent dehydrogenase (short-subunit alcohol dehydrogenase family)
LSITFHLLDVTSDESCQKLADFIQKEFGKLDVLINNAGIFLDSRYKEFGKLDVVINNAGIFLDSRYQGNRIFDTQI